MQTILYKQEQTTTRETVIHDFANKIIKYISIYSDMRLKKQIIHQDYAARLSDEINLQMKRNNENKIEEKTADNKLK